MDERPAHQLRVERDVDRSPRRRCGRPSAASCVRASSSCAAYATAGVPIVDLRLRGVVHPQGAMHHHPRRQRMLPDSGCVNGQYTAAAVPRVVLSVCGMLQKSAEHGHAARGDPRIQVRLEARDQPARLPWEAASAGALPARAAAAAAARAETLAQLATERGELTSDALPPPHGSCM
eukprot:619942-Prymnesium_polylepis.1